MAGIELDHVWKRYGEDVVAVKDFCLVADDGEFMVLVGPSGCGKTTTMRMIAGLETLTDGRILFGGEDVSARIPKERDVAMVFQNYALFPHLSVYSNIAFGMRLRKVPKNEIDQKVRQAAGILGIEPLLHRKPKELSGGQRQRVALGRAIVREPQVFLMDEPLSNIDAKLRVEMRAEISKLQRRLGVTTFYVTHDQVEALSMGDRIVVMCDGRIQQVGTPTELYVYPENRYVAGFIGSPAMNFMSARLDGESIRLVGQDTAWDIPSNLMGQALRQKPVSELWLGVRPEHIELSTDTQDGHYSLPGTVDVLEPLGYSTLIQVQLDQGAKINVLVTGPTQAKVGDKLNASFAQEYLYIFDGQTDKALSDR